MNVPGTNVNTIDPLELENFENNPWSVADLAEFLKYCCPECDFKDKNLHLFSSHAITSHKNSSAFFQNEDTMEKDSSYSEEENKYSLSESFKETESELESTFKVEFPDDTIEDVELQLDDRYVESNYEGDMDVVDDLNDGNQNELLITRNEPIINNQHQSSGNYEIVPGRTKTSKLYKHNGFLYRKNSSRPNKIFLNCQERKTNQKCMANAVLVINENLMFQKIKHNHGPPTLEAKVNVLRHKILDAAGMVTDSSLFTIFKNLTVPEKEIGHLLNFKSLEPGMRKRREDLYPKIPQSFEDIDLFMKNAPLDLNRHYKGLVRLDDTSPIGALFYHEKLFEELKHMKKLGYDGTYFVVPKPCYQLWTVHFVINQHHFPGVAVLLGGARTDMYKAIWKKIKQLLGLDFQPTDVSGDFEANAKNAVEDELPGIRINSCLSNYSQACFRNAQKHGLSKLYDEHLECNTWLKNIMAVPMLPVNLINTAFDDLLKQDLELPTRADEENLSRYKEYIVRQWQNNPNISHEILSVFECQNRIDNGCECYHAKLKSWIKVHRPSFWTFVFNFNRVLDFYHQEYLKLREFGEDSFNREPKKVTLHNAKICSKAEEGLTEGILNWHSFLATVSYTTKSFADRLQQEFKAHSNQLLDNDEN